MADTMIILLATTLIFSTTTGVSPASAHEPTHHWTCHLGGGGNDGKCYYHWPNAERGWHYLSEVPSHARTAIHEGAHSITDGHALTARHDSSAPSHIHWDSFCTGACVTNFSEDDGAEHILSFAIHFDSGWSWNTDTSLGHGGFSTPDLWNVAAHEWGHAVGLGHSDVGAGHECDSSNDVDSGWATLTEWSSCVADGHTEQRNLHDADYTGRCQVYSHAHGWSC